MDKIVKSIKENKLLEAKTLLEKRKSVDIAEYLEELDQETMLILFRLLSKDIASEVFSHMSHQQKKFIVESITDKEITMIINELFLDDTIDFLEELPANVVKKVLKNTDTQKRNLINQYLNYPDNSAGSIMTIEYVDLKKEMTVKDAIKYIKHIGIDKETINTCYVIDNNRVLEGIISIRKLILSEEHMLVNNIMDKDIIYVNTLDDQEQVADQFKKYDFLTMPVVDKEKRLVGIITIDDIVDIIEQENTEDFHKMAAMEPSEKEYLKTNVLVLAKHRIIWLLVLMISATFTGTIIRRFEDVLQSVVVLAAYIPMLMDTGGNAGSQSSTLIIRGMALGEIKIKHIVKVIWKEFRVSLIVGFILSIINFLRIYFIEKTDIYVSITVCVSLFFTIVIAKITGCILPIIAKKLRLDPAIMASPLITTIVDTVSLLIYFVMAGWLLHL